MYFWVKQGLVIVLSMQVDQAVAYFRKGGNCYRTIIKQAAVFPGVGNLAFDKQFALFHFYAGFQNQVSCFEISNFKNRFDKSVGFARADGIAICSAPEQEV